MNITHNIFKGIAVAISKVVVAVVLGAFSLSGHPLDTAKVGAAPQFTAAAPTTLYGSGVASSDTSIKVTALTTPNGYAIQTADLVGGATNSYYVTLEPATTKKETVSCKGVTQNTDGTAVLTTCTRGLLFTYPYTASTTLAKSHAGGSAVVVSNSPQLYNDIITYVNASASAGAADAAPTAKGIVEVATGAEAARQAQNGTGDTTAYLTLTTNIATSTRVASTPEVIVASSTTGYMDASFLYIATSTNFVNGNPIYNIGKTMFVASSTGTTTFAIPQGITKIHVQMCAGGGGGGSSNAGTSGSGGGGAGAYNEFNLDLTGTSTFTYVIGKGGVAGVGGGNNNGLQGEPTIIIWNSFNYTAFPGQGGTGGAAGQAGIGGATTTNVSLSVGGGNGQQGGSGGTTPTPAMGGFSFFGGGPSPQSALGAYCSGGFGGVNTAGGSGVNGVAIFSY